MRKPFLILSVFCILAMRPPATPALIVPIDVGFDERMDGPYPRGGPMLQAVRSILQSPRNGKDNWTWRADAEDQLASLGDTAIDDLKIELTLRDGLEADALQVAIFRLQNSGLFPAAALQAWGGKHFGIPPTVGNTLKITRIMDGKTGTHLQELFPHHLFYALEFNKTRTLVALAGDGKVQQLDNDAALGAFFRTEALPQPTFMGKVYLTSAASLLMLARNVTPEKPQFPIDALVTDMHASFCYTLQFGGTRQTATLTFTSNGQVETLNIGTLKKETNVAPAALAPDNSQAPPTLPK